MGGADRTVPLKDARRLAAAAAEGTRSLEIAAADHTRGHTVDPDAYEAAVEGHLREAFAATRPGPEGP
jgi:hypothetical protein